MRVAIGEFTQIEEEQLRFCYESIITEMPIAGSDPDDRIGLARPPVRIVPTAGRPKYWEGGCTGAGRDSAMSVLRKSCRSTEGEECAIRSVRISA